MFSHAVISKIHLLAALELHFSPISFLKLRKKVSYVTVYCTVATTWNVVMKVDIFISDKDWLTGARNIKSRLLNWVSSDLTYIWLTSSYHKKARLHLTSLKSQNVIDYIKLRRLWLYDAELFLIGAGYWYVYCSEFIKQQFFLQKCLLKRRFLQCMCGRVRGASASRATCVCLKPVGNQKDEQHCNRGTSELTRQVMHV